MAAMLSAMIASLSLTEKVNLNQLLAASIAADFGSKGPIAAAGSPIKAAKEKKAKKEKDPNAPKKAAAPGVLAWNAFVKHCKQAQPELFTGTTKESERLAICGGIKTRDTQAYEAWVKAWLAERSAAASEASSEAEDATEGEIAVAAPVAAVAQKPKAKKPTKKEKEAASTARAVEAAAAAAEAAAQNVLAQMLEASSEEEDEDEGGMVKKTIEGINYLMDPASLNLYKTNSSFEDVGAFAGKFEPAAGTIDEDADE
jgi:hypothetical protein